MNKREHAFSHWLFYTLVALVLAACGGGGSDLLPLQGVSSYQLSAGISSSIISPSGSTTVTVTLKDAAGAAAAGKTVQLAVSGPATLDHTSVVTNASGQATATITGNGSSSGQGSVSVTFVDPGNNIAKAGVGFSVVNGDVIILTTSKTSVKSGAGDTATITAFVTDSSGNAQVNKPVSFGVSSGSLGSPTNSGSTDSAGRISIPYNPDTQDRSNKQVTINATTTSGSGSGGTINAAITLDIVGTNILLTSPQSTVTIGSTVTINGTLTDGNNVAIANKTVTLSNPDILPGGSVTLVTDALGKIPATSVTINTAPGGTATFTASGQGATGTLSIAVSGTSFSISTPAADGAELSINTAQTFSLKYLNGGVGVAGQTIYFSTSLGSLSAPSAVTNASGIATVTLSSAYAGVANLQANTAGNALHASRSALFVATTPSQISVQAAQTNLSPAQQTSITATVRDAANNPVKNMVVQFNAVQDDSGGNLSSPTAVTDASGQASVTYTAGPSSGKTNGVEINATVQSNTAVTTKVYPATPTNARLTVGGTAAFISIGSGNTLTEVNSTTYADPHNIIVTDSSGAPIRNQQVVLSIIPINYYKGHYYADFANNVWAPEGPTGTGNGLVPRLACDNEDLNRDAILNAGEDTNGNGKLDPGLPVTLSQGIVTTDDQGLATFTVIYGKDKGHWLRVELSATATVTGTESKNFIQYNLTVLAKDVALTGAPPGGSISAYGNAPVCTDPN